MHNNWELFRGEALLFNCYDKLSYNTISKQKLTLSKIFLKWLYGLDRPRLLVEACFFCKHSTLLAT